MSIPVTNLPRFFRKSQKIFRSGFGNFFQPETGLVYLQNPKGGLDKPPNVPLELAHGRDATDTVRDRLAMEIDHPDDSQLTSYLLGRLESQQLDAIESHLDRCSDCQERALKLNPKDELVKLVSTSCSSENGGGLPSVPIMSEFPPREFENHPRYRLLRPLGRGGMGVVWLAQHLVMHRLVAIKLIHTVRLSDGEAALRFQRETRAAAKLHHPNIVTTYDADQIDDRHFLVMEFVEGQTLAQLIREAPLSIPEACAAIRDVALGLQNAHEVGVIHRDIKPGNLIRTTDGSVKVLDFGIAFVPSDEDSLTASNMVVGTADYVSPEQALHPRDADARSDIYSLGCTFYHLLAGKTPFNVSGVLAKLDAHRQSVPPPLSGIPEPLQRIVSKMMARDPKDRYQTALEVERAISDYCEGRSSSEGKPRLKMVATSEEKLQRVLIVGGLVTLAIVSVSLFYGWTSKSTRQSLSQIIPPREVEPDPPGPPPVDPSLLQYNLLRPTAIGEGTEDDYAIEASGLTIDAVSRSRQVWLNYRYFVSKEIKLRMTVQFLEAKYPSFLKVAFLSDPDGEEYNVQVWPDTQGNVEAIRVEFAKPKPGAPPDLHLLAEVPVESVGSEPNQLEIVFEEDKIIVRYNNEEVVQCPYTADKYRFPAIAAYRSRVQITDPTATTFE